MRLSENPIRHDANPTTDQQPWRPLVLFDGGCPLCRHEIAHYGRRTGADRVNWIDLSRQPRDEPVAGIDWHQAMARFHVRDARGEWQCGAYGFVELWSHLRGYRLLAWTVRRLGLVGLLDRAYTVFARRRLAARCNDDSCSIASKRFNRLGSPQP